MIKRHVRAASLLGICLWAGFASATAEVGYQDWQFPNDANPSMPTVATNTAGTATATIVVGYLGLGWLDSLSSFGTQTGLWDLGFQNSDDLAHDTRGQAVLSVPNPLPATSNTNTYTDLNLAVVQFVDGFLYTGGLGFSISGAVYSGRTIVEALPGLGGNWVQDQFHWRLTPSPAQISLCITGAVRGTLLDGIIIDTVSAVRPALQLLITSVAKLNQALTISWEGGLPPYQIYVTSNLLSDGPWEAVGVPVFGTSAEIPLNGPVEFIRVRGSN